MAKPLRRGGGVEVPGRELRSRLAASREVERQVRLHKVERNAFLVHRNHLVALALARAGVIVYRSDLAPDRWQAHNSYAALCDDIVRAAEVKVRQLPGR